MGEYIVRMPDDMPYEIKTELNAWYIESEPIVRCRDCGYSSCDGQVCWLFRHKEKRPDCTWYDMGMDVEPDGFCAWGARAE